METEEVALRIAKQLAAAGHQALYAGGWVRDKLLGLPSQDIDIATSALPNEVIALFPKTVPVGIAFGSVIVVEDGIPFEVTTFRTEGDYQDGRRPSKVDKGTAEEDAQRRGLTINGMFYDPLTREVIDYVGGKADLEAGIIRAIGDPFERFNEDKLRMIRAARFASRFNFTIEQDTEKAIQAHVHELFPAVAIERVWQEFHKMTGHPKFGQFLRELHRLGLLSEILPELDGAEDLSKQTAPFSEFPPDAPTVAYLMELFPNLKLSHRLGICARLKIPNTQMQFVEKQAELEKLLSEASSLTQWTHFLASDQAETCLLIAAARLGDTEKEMFLAEQAKRQERLAPHVERIRSRSPLVSAEMLKKMEITPGPEMGKLLKRAESIAIEQDLHDSAAVLNRLKDEIGRPE